MTEKDKIVLCGDIHGEYNKLRYDINRFGHENAYIIQVGDFGVGFNKPNYYKTELGKLNDFLVSKNNHLYAIRGNHDNPEYFKETNNPFELSNITLLSDYSELTLLNKNYLFVGGAVSIDRSRRMEGKSWWKDEKFVLREDFPYKSYDVVVTHTRPGICGAFKGFANIAGWFDEDDTLKADVIIESQHMDKLWEFTKPKHWVYGHFHASEVTEVNGTIFRCLNIDEHYEIL